MRKEGLKSSSHLLGSPRAIRQANRPHPTDITAKSVAVALRASQAATRSRVQGKSLRPPVGQARDPVAASTSGAREKHILRGALCRTVRRPAHGKSKHTQVAWATPRHRKRCQHTNTTRYHLRLRQGRCCAPLGAVIVNAHTNKRAAKDNARDDEDTQRLRSRARATTGNHARNGYTPGAPRSPLDSGAVG